MSYPFLPSTNFDDRNKGAVIDKIILHHTADYSGEAVAFLALPHAASSVSSHYLVFNDGGILQLVNEEKRAWHAGISEWRGVSNLNDTSIGIEIINLGGEPYLIDKELVFPEKTSRFPYKQMLAVGNLVQDILNRRPNIPLRNVIGHSDIAPNRKTDPQVQFDWAYLASRELTLPIAPPRIKNSSLIFEPGQTDPKIGILKDNLKNLGYGYLTDGNTFDQQTVQVVAAFKRHFVPESLLLDKISMNYWDSLADARLNYLIKYIS